jgi:hypothetical protein
LAQTSPCTTDLPSCPLLTLPPQKPSVAPTPLGWTNTPTSKTSAPISQSGVPTMLAYSKVTLYPTDTIAPTEPEPTREPSREPTRNPSWDPSAEPTPEPTPGPTAEPTPEPSSMPTETPTEVIQHPSTIIGITSGVALFACLLLSLLCCWCVLFSLSLSFGCQRLNLERETFCGAGDASADLLQRNRWPKRPNSGQIKTFAMSH